MSLDAQDWVWEHSQAKGTARLVLLAIADKANGADCSAYAGTTMLMQRSRASRRAVINAVDTLLGSGELQLVEGRKGPNGETRYRLPLAQRHRRGQSNGGADSAPVQNLHRCKSCTGGGADSAPGGCKSCTGRGADSAPHNARNAENTEGTQGGSAPAGEHTSSQLPAQRSDDRLAPIDIDGFRLTDPMRRWARLDGYADLVDIDHSTAQFVSHYRSTGARRKSWPDAWQKWIRDDAKRAAERGQRAHLPAAAGAENVLHLPAARRPSITDQRVADGFALADRLAAEEGTRP